MDIKVYKQQEVLNLDGTKSIALIQTETVKTEELIMLKESLDIQKMNLDNLITNIETKLNLIENLEEGKDYIIIE